VIANTYSQEERRGQAFGSPPPGWERCAGDPGLIKIPAVALVEAARFQREFRIAAGGALVLGTEYALAVVGDPGERVLVSDHYSSHGIGPLGIKVAAGLVHDGAKFYNLAGLDVGKPLPAHWPRLLGSLHHSGDRVVDEQAVYAMVSSAEWPFTVEEWEGAFAEVAGGMLPIRRGCRERILKAYHALTPREQGLTLRKAAACRELADFNKGDLDNPVCEKVFLHALETAIGSAGVAGLRALEAGIVGDGHAAG